VLQHIRCTIGEYNFAGQYQQQPTPLGGGMVKAEWFKFYAPGEQPSKFEIVFQSWDTANKSTELSDYSVCTTWGLKRKKLYLLHVYRKRLEFPELKRAIVSSASHFRASNILIEDKASGTALIQDLIRDGVLGVTSYEPIMDKIMRLHSVSSTIENGFVYSPEQADWLAEYLHELTTFPSTKHDDQADSTSQALDWVRTRPTYPVSEYNLRKALELGGPIYKWMLDDFEKDQEPVKCPQCNSSPTQSGRRCQCQTCGRQWELPNPFNRDETVYTCRLPDGTILFWDESRGLWLTMKPAKPIHRAPSKVLVQHRVAPQPAFSIDRWVMSPGGQSNLLLIRRLLHPTTPDFDPIRGRFFAQVLLKFWMVRNNPRLRIRNGVPNHKLLSHDAQFNLLLTICSR